MSLLSMCSTTVTLQRQTRTKDAAGGVKRTWTTIESDVPADIQPASSRTVLAYMQQQLKVSHSIYLGEDVAAKPTDRFTSDGRIFKVNGYRPAGTRDEWPAVADCEEELTL